MGNMPFLKTNKTLLYSVLFVLPFFCVDKSIALWLEGYANNMNRFVDGAFVFISNGATLIGLSLCLYFFAGRYSQKLCSAGRSLVISMISAGVVVQILKHLFGRARPRITYDTVFIGPSLRGSYDSFPSGHSALAFCLAYVLSKYYPKYKAAWYFFAFIVAFGRLISLAHFPSDIFAGAVVGTFVATIFMAKTFANSDERTSLPQVDSSGASGTGGPA